MSQDQNELAGLLKKICQGDQTALGLFYDKTIGKVLGIALKITMNQTLAEEITSDVYLQVWRHAIQYDAERTTPIGWLMMLAYSRSIDTLRREQTITVQQIPLDDNLDYADTQQLEPMAALRALEQHQQIGEALKLLTSQERQMIALAFYRGMSHQEIADHTHEPLGTVKSIIRRAQTVLKGAMLQPGDLL